MRESIREAIGTTVQDMLDCGFTTSFTKKELDTLSCEACHKIESLTSDRAAMQIPSSSYLTRTANQIPS
jgi:hypothetical protein